MNLPPLSGIFAQDHTGILRPLNTFLAAVVRAFDRGISVRENTRSVVTSRRLHHDGSAVTGLPVEIAWPYAEPPLACVVVHVAEKDVFETAAVTAAPHALWRPGPGKIVVYSLLGGFSSAGHYDVTFHAYA